MQYKLSNLKIKLRFFASSEFTSVGIFTKLIILFMNIPEIWKTNSNYETKIIEHINANSFQTTKLLDSIENL